MAAPRKKAGTIARRRRRDEEGDDMSVATEVADDSQSDVSVPSDVDEDADADADNSDLSEVDSSRSLTQASSKGNTNGSARPAKPRADATNGRVPSPPIARSDATFPAPKDTEMMMNGLKISDTGANDEVVDFETGNLAVEPPSAPSAPSTQPESFAERKRREHEEYKKKRDSDPAFIPNRGNFFMHDQRSAPGQGGFRQFGPRGGGRGGRGGPLIGGPYSPANLRAQAAEATDAPWQHDLHETVIQPAPAPTSQHQPAPQAAAPRDLMSTSFPQPAKAPAAQAPKPPQTRNFSTTVHTHNAVIRVFLPEMKTPIVFQNVPIKQHTRLPNHRPPLRRDKPVRISLPPAAPRYIFPTVERSFIFIPRALRPNQQGFGGRGRGRNFGSFGGGFSSRRTSAYGGSVYSPSVAMSRRSSIAREMGRDNLVSPAGSVMSRATGFADASRPVVRLPPGGPRMPMGPPMMSPHAGTPTGPQTYPLPQKPAFRENWQGQLPMHQPRPQKAVSVAGIESPASMTFNPPQQQEQQPFHQQVPAHINGGVPSTDQQPVYPHARQMSFGQVSNGTPLSNIPERAVHAASFQPYQQPPFQPQGYPMQPGFYYPQNGAQPFVPPAGMVPLFVPNAQQHGYVVPMPAQPVPSGPAPTSQPSLVPYEQNGMTYYMDPAQVPQIPQIPRMYPQPPMDGFQQPSYAVPGMGGMMTPSPEGAQYYYPQQMQGTAYYPPQ